MMNYQVIYEAESAGYETTWKNFTQAEIDSLKKDAETENLYFLAIDYNCTIAVVRYILKYL